LASNAPSLIETADCTQGVELLERIVAMLTKLIDP
jgi:hypothetical protein